MLSVRGFALGSLLLLSACSNKDYFAEKSTLDPIATLNPVEATPKITPTEAKHILVALDTTFGTSGLTQIAWQSNDRPGEIAVLSDDTIIIGGLSATAADDNDFALAKFTKDGLHDATFGNPASPGRVVTNLGGLGDKAWDLLINPDGTIFLGGYGVGNWFDFGIAKYLSNGTLDTSFSADGKHRYYPVVSRNDRGRGVAVDSHGHIVLAGYSNPGTAVDSMLITRLQSDGQWDPTFHGNGYFLNPLGIATSSYLWDIAIDKSSSDDKILLVGSAIIAGPQEAVVMRMNHDGSLDATFGTNGVTVIKVPGVSSSNALKIIQLSDNKIFIGGEATVSGALQVFVARLTSNGAMDTTFGSSGISVTSFSGANNLNDVVLFSNGEIMAVGGQTESGRITCAVWKFNSQGMVDTNFSTDGRFLLNFDTASTENACQSIALQSNGAPIISGYAMQALGYQAFVGRLKLSE